MWHLCWRLTPAVNSGVRVTVSRSILNFKCNSHSEEIKNARIRRLWIQEEDRRCFHPPRCHSALTPLSVSEHTPFCLEYTQACQCLPVLTLALLVILVLISGAGLAHWVDLWLNFKRVRPRNFSLHLGSSSWIKHLHHVIMQIEINTPRINSSMGNQGLRRFGLYQWVEQAPTILSTVTHHFCNGRAFQEWTLRRKYVGVYSVTQEIKHSEGLFPFYCILLNPGCGIELYEGPGNQWYAWPADTMWLHEILWGSMLFWGLASRLYHLFQGGVSANWYIGVWTENTKNAIHVKFV